MTRGRVLGGLALFVRTQDDAFSHRKRVALAVLKETRDGLGAEDCPATWRDRAVALLDDATRRGADHDRAREVARRFLARMDARFDAFERGLWRWVYDVEDVPLPEAAAALWGVQKAHRGVPLHLGTAPFEDLEAVARELEELVNADPYDVAERAAIQWEGAGGA